MSFWSKYLPTGIKIVFLAQPREIGYLAGLDINAQKKVALDIRYLAGKKNKMTGYWFNVWDFDPPLDTIDIKNYGGVVVVYKSRDGQNSFLPEALRSRIEREKTLRRIIEIYQKSNVELLDIIEGEKVSEKRKLETIDSAKQLKTLKGIVGDIEIRKTKELDSGIGSLFKR